MTGIKPLTLHAHAGPNPWKAALILEELSLPYICKICTDNTTRLNPVTGLATPVPAAALLEDPNAGVAVWECGAIASYLLDTYDASFMLSRPASDHQGRAAVNQFLFAQATLQAPSMSNALRLGREGCLPDPESARIVRGHFVREALRVLAVLEEELRRKGGGRVGGSGGRMEDGGGGEGGTEEEERWLVGESCTAADLVFVPYMWYLDLSLGGDAPDLDKDYPNLAAWLRRLNEREAVKKVKAVRDDAVAAYHAAREQSSH